VADDTNEITCAAERIICMFLFCGLAAFDQIGRESDWNTPIIWQRKQQVQSGKVCTGNGLVIIWPHAQQYTSDETDVDSLLTFRVTLQIRSGGILNDRVSIHYCFSR